MILIQVDGPQEEPVDLETARLHRVIETTDQDDLLRTMIKAARSRLERETGRAFLDQEWEMQLPAFEDEIEIPKPPCIAVEEITYLDGDENELTLDSSAYRIIKGGVWHARVRFRDGELPDDVADVPDAVRIRFRAGWETAENVPEELKIATLSLTGSMFENREEVLLTPTRQELQQLPDGVEALISTWRVPRLG